MEYVHAALLLHSAGKPVDEAALTKVIDATGEKADGSRVKALVAALDGVDIKAAIEKAVAVPAVVAAAPVASGAAAPAKEEKKDEKTEEQAAEGLGSLFG